MEKLTSESHGSKSFRDYYDSLPSASSVKPPKKEFRERIAAITGCSLSAVNGWIAGAYQPNNSAKILIAKELGIPANVLFPEKESELCEK